MFENMAMRTTFGLKRENTGDWKNA